MLSMIGEESVSGLKEENKCFHSFDTFLREFQSSVDQAQKQIDINVYIFNIDSVGKKILKQLDLASQRGVKIRLLIDGYGSKDAFSHLAEYANKKNIFIRVYHPIIFSRSLFSYKVLRDFLSKINKRDHKKLYIFDNNFYYVGSANLSKSSFDQRETMVRVHSSTDEAKNYFNYTWDNAHELINIGKIPFKFKKPRIKKFDQLDLICNFNYASRKENYTRLLRKLQGARRIWLMTPYFMPPKKFLEAIGDVAQSGGDVRLVLPDKLDIPSMKIATMYFYPYLIKRGVRIFLYQNIMLHSKVTIIDNDYIVGSSNLDNRSFFTNLEVDVFAKKENVKKDLEKQYLKDLENSLELASSDLKKTPLYAQILSRIFFFFRRWL